MNNEKSLQARYEKAIETVKQGAKVVELIEEDAKNALVVTGLWNEAMEGEEIEALISCFLGSARMITQRNSALTVAIDLIEGLRPDFNSRDVDGMLEEVNKALIGQTLEVSLEGYIPMSTTIQ